ncbi:hypothetical protein ACFX13_022499 [Malus domestica]
MAQENSVNQEVESTLASSPTNFFEVDINPTQRLSSVLLNEFNYLPWSMLLLWFLVEEPSSASSMESFKHQKFRLQIMKHGYAKIN